MALVARPTSALDALLSQAPGDPPLPTLHQLLGRPDWHQLAACRGVGTDAFFIERGESSAPARTYCDGCPVTGQCAASALANRESHGIWAGRSADRLRRAQPRPGADLDPGPSAGELRRLLAASGVTKAELSRKAGVNPRTLRNWLEESNKIPRQRAHELHQVLTDLCPDLHRPPAESA